MRSVPLSNRIRSTSFLRNLTDDSLVAQAKLGNEQAFIELWSRHGERVRNLLLRIVRNREDAEDLLQEVYLKSFLHLVSFNGDSLFSTWLSRIGINLALMLLRKRRNRPEVFLESPDSDLSSPIAEFPDRAESIETCYLRAERIEELRLAIQRLPPQLRYVIELQTREELPLEEIARRIGISVAAVKARLVRARAALRDLTSPMRTRRGARRFHTRSTELNHLVTSIGEIGSVHAGGEIPAHILRTDTGFLKLAGRRYGSS